MVLGAPASGSAEGFTMAIRIRCQECKKRISIDEAFAGGMCRCPYCKALVYVDEATGGGAKGSGVSRPSAPMSRPAAPGQAAEPVMHSAGPSANEPVDTEHIPMARPVKIQGIITIILLVLLVFMVGGGIAVALLYLPGGQNGDIPPPPEFAPTINRVPESGPGVVDIRVATPIIYVLDGGSGMRSAFDSARLVTMHSVESLGGEKYNVMVSGEAEDKLLSPDFVPGGKKGVVTLTTFLEAVMPMGASDIPRSLTAALAKKPKTIVLFTRKPVDNAMSQAEQAKAQGTVIHTITIEGDREVIDSMKKLAEASGGKARDFLAGGG